MQLAILIGIVIINTFLAIGYLIWGLFAKDKKTGTHNRTKYILLSAAIFVCPLVAVCFLVLSHVVYWLFSKREVDMRDVSFSREKIRPHMAADMRRDINIVPMKDVLSISDVQNRRRMLLDVLKKDARKALGIVAMAMENEDSETSHYAASIVTDALSEFRGNMQNMLDEFRKEKEEEDGRVNTELGLLILHSLSGILQQNVLTGAEKTSYVYTAEDVAETLFRNDHESLSGFYYRKLTEIMAESGDGQLAEKWAQRGLENRPDELDSYVCSMKLYFDRGDREAFFDCMDRLKESSVPVSKELMEYIRLFHRQEEA